MALCGASDVQALLDNFQTVAGEISAEEIVSPLVSPIHYHQRPIPIPKKDLKRMASEMDEFSNHGATGFTDQLTPTKAAKEDTKFQRRKWEAFINDSLAHYTRAVKGPGSSLEECMQLCCENGMGYQGPRLEAIRLSMRTLRCSLINKSGIVLDDTRCANLRSLLLKYFPEVRQGHKYKYSDVSMALEFFFNQKGVTPGSFNKLEAFVHFD